MQPGDIPYWPLSFLFLWLCVLLVSASEAPPRIYSVKPLMSSCTFLTISFRILTVTHIMCAYCSKLVSFYFFNRMTITILGNIFVDIGLTKIHRILSLKVITKSNDSFILNVSVSVSCLLTKHTRSLRSDLQDLYV